MGPFNKERETMGREELAEAIRTAYGWTHVSGRYEITAGVREEIVLGRITEVPSIKFTPDGTERQRAMIEEARRIFTKEGLGEHIEN